jgi:hypothetical protein
MSRIGIALMTALMLAWSGAARAGLPELRDLDGGRIAEAGGPTIIAFWRTDCAPCLIELRGARAYAQAARPGRLLFVGLQPAAPLRSAAARAGAPLSLIARSPASPAAILTAFGGAPPRLPLAVAFDRHGRVCERHAGLLGTEQVRAWVRACGGPDARG